MTKDQLTKIDELFMVRGKMAAKEIKLLDSFGRIKNADPAINLPQTSGVALDQLHQKYTGPIKRAKVRSYVLQPSGDPEPIITLDPDKKAFIDEHFPTETVKELFKAGFFDKRKPSYEEIDKRVCQWFKLDSIFDYAKIGEGVGYHLSLTKRGLDQLKNKSDGSENNSTA